MIYVGGRPTSIPAWHFNEHHDERGRFTSGGGSSSGKKKSLRTLGEEFEKAAGDALYPHYPERRGLGGRPAGVARRIDRPRHPDEARHGTYWKGKPGAAKGYGAAYQGPRDPHPYVRYFKAERQAQAYAETGRHIALAKLEE